MASPQSTTSLEDQSKKNLEQITFRFCAECSNMLYPKEDEDAHKLQFTCRTCQYTEEAASTCVFRNVLNNAAGETAGVTQDVGSDPTVGAAFFPASATSSASASASTPASPVAPLPSPHALVLCLCCGDAISCRGCGVQMYAPSAGASTSDDDDDDDDVDSAYESDCHRADVNDMVLDMLTYGDLSCLSDEYGFENGMEFGNGDESDAVAVF